MQESPEKVNSRTTEGNNWSCKMQSTEMIKTRRKTLGTRNVQKVFPKVWGPLYIRDQNPRDPKKQVI